MSHHAWYLERYSYNRPRWYHKLCVLSFVTSKCARLKFQYLKPFPIISCKTYICISTDPDVQANVGSSTISPRTEPSRLLSVELSEAVLRLLVFDWLSNENSQAGSFSELWSVSVTHRSERFDFFTSTTSYNLRKYLDRFPIDVRLLVLENPFHLLYSVTNGNYSQNLDPGNSLKTCFRLRVRRIWSKKVIYCKRWTILTLATAEPGKCFN